MTDCALSCLALPPLSDVPQDLQEKIPAHIFEVLGRVRLPLHSDAEEAIWSGVKFQFAAELSERVKKYKPCKLSLSRTELSVSASYLVLRIMVESG